MCPKETKQERNSHVPIIVDGFGQKESPKKRAVTKQRAKERDGCKEGAEQMTTTGGETGLLDRLDKYKKQQEKTDIISQE